MGGEKEGLWVVGKKDCGGGVKKDRGGSEEGSWGGRRIVGVEEKDCRGELFEEKDYRWRKVGTCVGGKEQLWFGREKDYRWRRRIAG